MSDAETVHFYIQKLIEIGIEVPLDVQVAAQALWDRQLEFHGK